MKIDTPAAGGRPADTYNRVTLLSLALAGLTALSACTTPQESGPVESGKVAGNNGQSAVTAPVTAAPPAAGPEDPARPLPAARKGMKSLQMYEMSASGAPAGRLYSRAIMAVDGLGHIRPPGEALDREHYHAYDDNGVCLAAETPVSTFSIDVDTGAYSNVRRMLNSGRLPPQDAVRIEELVNYFSYDYPDTGSAERPFSVTTEIAVAPWNADSRLVHIGIKGMDTARDSLPPANLVFLVDVSGSMSADNKLPLLKSALKLLVGQLRDEDTIALAVYAGASGTVLEPTPGSSKAKILAAIDGLGAGGSTNGAAGIRLAYQLAEQSYQANGINRILLATDGDFNVGTTDFEQLKDLIEERRRTGISLTTLGFGSGNYNDHLMEQLADAGNGNHAYIDNLNEAQKSLVNEVSSTLHSIAKDVKIQVEFNPAVVTEYRLIGYENRALKREDFNNDKVDAGEIGAGHSVTALYEIRLVNSRTKWLEPLRYARDSKPAAQAGALNHELAMLRIRYERPGEADSRLIEQPLLAGDIVPSVRTASENFRFSAAVAAFGQLLRGGRFTAAYGYDDILELARGARGRDDWGYRGEFIQLVNLAASLAGADRQPDNDNAGQTAGRS